MSFSKPIILSYGANPYHISATYLPKTRENTSAKQETRTWSGTWINDEKRGENRKDFFSRAKVRPVLHVLLLGRWNGPHPSYVLHFGPAASPASGQCHMVPRRRFSRRRRRICLGRSHSHLPPPPPPMTWKPGRGEAIRALLILPGALIWTFYGSYGFFFR